MGAWFIAEFTFALQVAIAESSGSSEGGECHVLYGHLCAGGDGAPGLQASGVLVVVLLHTGGCLADVTRLSDHPLVTLSFRLFIFKLVISRLISFLWRLIYR